MTQFAWPQQDDPVVVGDEPLTRSDVWVDQLAVLADEASWRAGL